YRLRVDRCHTGQVDQPRRFRWFRLHRDRVQHGVVFTFQGDVPTQRAFGTVSELVVAVLHVRQIGPGLGSVDIELWRTGHLRARRLQSGDAPLVGGQRRLFELHDPQPGFGLTQGTDAGFGRGERTGLDQGDGREQTEGEYACHRPAQPA